jgi:protein associated with RNAse G/E
MFRSMSEVEYYVNMASPTIKESDSVFSFVDYDLDLKKESDGHVKEIDLGEYAHNRSVYGYSEKLCFVLEKSFKEIEQMMNESAFPFDDKKNIQMYNLYLKELHESKSL